MKKRLCILSIGFLAFVLCTGAYAAVEPIITANGMTGTVNVAAGSAVTVRIQLSPGDREGTDADWWLICNTFGKWYYYTLDGKFNDIGSSSDIGKLSPTYQGKLVAMPAWAILQIPELPAGTYTLYFGVDTDMNGKLDADSLVFRELNIISGTSKALKSDLTRNMSPDASQDDLKSLVIGNNAFAFDFYQAISGNNDNIFFSPYSISMAFAMAYTGAANNTAGQIGKTMHFTLSQDRLHSAFNALNIGLAGRAQDKFRLNIANSLWGQSDYLFLTSFLDIIESNYGAVLKRTDFEKSPEESRITINNWVSDNTEAKIRDLLPQGSVDSLTRLILVNAIYFNATWENPFEKISTYDDVFYLSDGSRKKIPMMHKVGNYNYAEGDGYQIAELPYKGGEVSMIILLPESEKFEDFEKSLTASRLDEILANRKMTEIELTMPKFRFESGSLSLTDTLSGMGMPDAFTREIADFSGMDGTRLFYISDAVHKAFIEVDEKGTEAAAATAIVVTATGYPPPPPPRPKMIINRPFIYFIRDMSGTVLFMGRMVNPPGGTMFGELPGVASEDRKEKESSHPYNITDFIPLQNGYGIQVVKNSTQYSLRYVPLSDPENGQAIGELDLGDTPYSGAFTDGNMIYLVSSGSGTVTVGSTLSFLPAITKIQAIDFSIPQTPVRRESVELTGNYSKARQDGSSAISAIDSGLIYQMNGSVLVIPYAKAYQGELPVSGEAEINFLSDTDQMTFYSQNYYAEKGVRVLDFSDPDHPKEISDISLDDVMGISGCFMNGKMLYVSHLKKTDNAQSEPEYYLTRVDLSDPAAPMILKSVSIPAPCIGADSSGAYIFTMKSYAWGYIYYTTIDGSEKFISLKLDGDNAYPADKTISGGYYSNAIISDGFAYLNGSGGITIVDISNPEKLKPYEYRLSSGSATLFGVKNRRIFAGVSVYNPDNTSELIYSGTACYDASDPENLVLEKFWDKWVNSSIVFSDDKAYLPMGYYGLRMMSLSD